MSNCISQFCESADLRQRQLQLSVRGGWNYHLRSL